MATLISDIADLFLTNVNDYRLTAIYTASGSSGLNNFIEPWLLNSIIEFDVCDQELDYVVTSGSMEGYFPIDLTLENKLIMSQLMVKHWLHKEINDVLQMNNFIQDHDFKTHSAANNLQSKKDYYNTKREELSQKLVDYAYKRNDFTAWGNQIFMVEE